MMLLKIFLSIGFYIAFKFLGVSIGSLGPEIILYTTLAYVATFAAIVYFILRRNAWGLRAGILLDFIASIPAGAAIGLVIAAVSMFLSFRPTAKAYLAAS